jgi:hypothetical protein
VGNNPNLCGSDSCNKKKSNVVVPIVASLGGLLILAFIVAAIFLGIRIKRREQHGKTKGENFNYKIHVDVNKEKHLLNYR